MKTLVQEAFGPPSDLVTQEVEQPVPGPGEALVRVKTAGVGFVDGLMVQGLYQVKPPLPYRPGSEFAGVVTAVGADVQSVQANERVLVQLAALGLPRDRRLAIRRSVCHRPGTDSNPNDQQARVPNKPKPSSPH